VARPVCSVCGSVLSISQGSCTACGATIDWGAGSKEEIVPATPKIEVCSVCGFTNTRGGETCESCGARLDGSGVVAQAPEPQPDRVQKKNEPDRRHKKKKYQRESRKQRRVDPYVAGAVGVIVLIVGIFAYSELTRAPEPGPTSPATPETASQLDEVNRLQSSVDANPNDVGSLLRLANVLHDMSLKDSKLLPRAVENYNKYLALRPNDPNARVDLGIVYYELSKVDPSNREDLENKSLHEMEAVAKANPDHQPAAFNLGIVSMNTGKRDEARTWLNKAIAINPNSDLGIRAKKILQEIP
jgi:cytochrome c-type biogenesis protein CcmH/NrfG